MVMMVWDQLMLTGSHRQASVTINFWADREREVIYRSRDIYVQADTGTERRVSSSSSLLLYAKRRRGNELILFSVAFLSFFLSPPKDSLQMVM